MNLDEAEVNHVYFCENEISNLYELDGEELRLCRYGLHERLMITQPLVVVVVGGHLLKKFLVIDHAIEYGVQEEIVWENTGRCTVVYCVPNTRRSNRSVATDIIQRYAHRRDRSLLTLFFLFKGVYTFSGLSSKI